MAEFIEIAEFGIDLKELLSESTELRKQLDLLRDSLIELKKDDKAATEEIIKQEIEIKSLNEEYKKRMQLLQAASDSVEQDLTREIQLNNALSAQVDTLRKLRENNKQLNALKVDAPLGSEELEKINAQLDRNNDLIRENSDSYTKQKINIGNYSDSVKDAFSGLGLFDTQTNKLIATFKLLPGVLKAGKTGVVSLKAALISSGIGAIVVALGTAFMAIRNAIKRNEESASALTSAFAPLKGMINTVKDALVPLGDLLINGIAKGLESIQGLFLKTLDSISKGLARLMFLKKAAEIKEFSDRLREGAAEASEFSDAQDRLRRNTRGNEVAIAGLRRESERLKVIRDDEQSSLKERLEANKRVFELEGMMTTLKKQNLEEEIALVELQISQEGRKTELLDKLAQLNANLVDIEQQGDALRRRATRRQNALIRQGNQEREEQLNKQISQMRKEVELFELQQKERRTTLEESLKVDEEVAEKRIEILKQELGNKKITQTEFDIEMLKIEQELENKRNEIKEQNELAKIEEDERKLRDSEAARALAFEKEIERMREEGTSRLEIEKAIIDEELELQKQALDEMELTEKEHALELYRIEKDASDKKKALREAEKMAQINAATQTLDSVASVIDADSELAAGIALSKAGIALWLAIANANTIPFPANIASIAQAGATGYNAIKQITKQSIPSASGGGRVSASGGGAQPQRPQSTSTGFSSANISNRSLVASSVSKNDNMKEMAVMMSAAVREGASSGTEQGMVGLSTNKRIQESVRV